MFINQGDTPDAPPASVIEFGKISAGTFLKTVLVASLVYFIAAVAFYAAVGLDNPQFETVSYFRFILLIYAIVAFISSFLLIASMLYGIGAFAWTHELLVKSYAMMMQNEHRVEIDDEPPITAVAVDINAYILVISYIWRLNYVPTVSQLTGVLLWRKEEKRSVRFGELDAENAERALAQLRRLGLINGEVRVSESQAISTVIAASGELPTLTLLP